MPFVQLDRRAFIALAGGTAVSLVAPIIARAQPGDKVHRVGIIIGDTPVMAIGMPAFREALRKLGFVQGRNLEIELKSAQQDKAGLYAATADLVRERTDVMVVGTVGSVDAAVAANPITPIVIWANNFDPIERGYVKSLARPGGRITGVFNRQPELAEKQVELLKDAFPDRKQLGILWDDVSADQFAAAGRRARALGLEVVPIKFEHLPYDIPAAFRRLSDHSVQLLLVLSTPFFALYEHEIVQSTIANKLPAMFIFRTYVVSGGLMSYGVDIEASFRRVADFVAKILNGARPDELPVELPTQYLLVVNLKTAKAIGIELPTSILISADEVIE